MRGKDEVVVYLVVGGTVESVDRRVFDWLRRIHHSYLQEIRLYVSRNISIIDHIDVSAANRVYEIG